MFSYLNYGWSPICSLRGPRWKYIRAPEPELYNLSNDPAERKNLYDEKRDLAGRLESKLEAAIAAADTSETGLAEDAALSGEDRERLQALGYVSGTKPDIEEASRRDPKDMIGFHDLINTARQAMWNGEVDEAERMLEKVVAGDPTNALARNMIGMVYRHRGKMSKARTQFEKAIELNPDYAEAYRNLGVLLFRQGDYRKAADSFERALELEPSAGSDCLALAEIYRKLGDDGRAGEYEARAAELGYPPR
jgi:choline-sulfatase